MGTTFKRGQELGRKDLDIFLKTKQGNPKNAAEISYNIYDVTTGTEVLLPPNNRTPINSSVGEYFASFVIPLDANLGQYRIRWNFREYTYSRVVEVVQEFSVVQGDVQLVNLPGATVIENDLIRSMRILLRDNNPARNYHFMPPSGEESVNQFTRVFGFIWEDAELQEYLKVSNDSINMYPPMTFYHTVDQLIMNQRAWRSLLLTGAMIYALQALSLNHVADEFNYSISGISLDIEKSGKYQGMMEAAQTRFNESVLAAKESVKIQLGLRQSRYGVGIRSSFGPSLSRGTISPRRFLGI